MAGTRNARATELAEFRFSASRLMGGGGNRAFYGGCPLLAPSRHCCSAPKCPLLGVRPSGDQALSDFPLLRFLCLLAGSANFSSEGLHVRPFHHGVRSLRRDQYLGAALRIALDPADESGDVPLG